MQNSYTHQLPSGTYYIKVYTTKGYSNETYTLTTKCNPLYTIGSSSTKNDQMDSTNSVFYKLTLASALGLKLALSNYGNSDYDLYVYDSNFNQMLRTSTPPEELYYTFQSGTYYIKVIRYTGTERDFTLKTSITIPSNDAYLVAGADYPTQMTVNDVTAVTILATNDGASTWTDSAGYKLSATNSSSAFVTEDIALSDTDSIGLGQSKSFIFNLTAPKVNTVTSYTTGWRMKQNSSAFGDRITKSITVKPDYEELTLNSYKNVYGKPNSQMYTFTINTAGYYALRTFYYSKACDTKLTLYNSALTELASNNDIYEDNHYSRVEAYLTPGTYYVELGEHNDASIYCQLLLEKFDYTTISNEQTVNITDKYEGYYRFTVPAAGTYIIGTKFYSQSSDTFLVLYDDMLAQTAYKVAANDNESTAYSRIVANLDAGTYYIRVTTYDYLKSAARKTVNCKLFLSKQSSAPSDENAPSIDITYPTHSSQIRLYDGSSLKISGICTNVSSITLKANGNILPNVKRAGNRFECNFSPSESGTYTITATGNASFGLNNPTTSITVTILVNDDGDTIDTATTIKEGTERRAAIDVAEDVDCFVFVPRESGYYSIHTTGNTDTVVQVRNYLYSLVGYNDDDYAKLYGNNGNVAEYLFEGQTYYIIVHHVHADEVGVYNIVVNHLKDDYDDNEYISLNQQIKARVDYPNDEEVFLFIPAESGEYTFFTTGETDTCTILNDQSGLCIDYNDDISDSNRNCRITVSLEAGVTYYFKVKAYSMDSYTTYYTASITQ